MRTHFEIKKLYHLIAVLFIAQNLFSQNWIQLSNFPGSKRDDGVAVYLNNKCYFGTGLQEGWSATIDFYELDLATLAWRSIATMPHTTERQYACAFTGNNCFYVFGGDGQGGALNNLYKYDILSNTWIQMNAKPGKGLSGASCMAFGDSVIVVGGRSNGFHNTNNEVWLYQLSNNTWTQRNDFPYGGRWRGCASVLNNTGYFMFGLDSTDIYRNEIFKYNLASDVWVKMPNFPLNQGRTYASLVTANHQLVLFGGKDSLNTYYNDTWYYYDKTNTWIKDQVLPSFGRKGGMCASDGQRIYYSCGINKSDQRLNETWMTDIPLGIGSEKNGTSLLNIFPNPAHDKLRVRISDSQSLNYTYRILTTNGIEVVALTLISEQETDIDLKQLAAGCYFLEIENQYGLIEIWKFIKL